MKNSLLKKSNFDIITVDMLDDFFPAKIIELNQTKACVSFTQELTRRT